MKGPNKSILNEFEIHFMLLFTKYGSWKHLWCFTSKAKYEIVTWWNIFSYSSNQPTHSNTLRIITNPLPCPIPFHCAPFPGILLLTENELWVVSIFWLITFSKSGKVILDSKGFLYKLYPYDVKYFGLGLSVKTRVPKLIITIAPPY